MLILWPDLNVQFMGSRFKKRGDMQEHKHHGSWTYSAVQIHIILYKNTSLCNTGSLSLGMFPVYKLLGLDLVHVVLKVILVAE